jgi:hypothetical protein
LLDVFVGEVARKFLRVDLVAAAGEFIHQLVGPRVSELAPDHRLQVSII